LRGPSSWRSGVARREPRKSRASRERPARPGVRPTQRAGIREGRSSRSRSSVTRRRSSGPAANREWIVLEYPRVHGTTTPPLRNDFLTHGDAFDEIVVEFVAET